MSGGGRQRTKPERPPAPPREANDARVTAVITAGWLAALVVLLVLVATGTLPGYLRWWSWTCATGVVLGVFGLWYVPVLKRNRERAAQRAAQEAHARQLQARVRQQARPAEPGEARIAGPGGPSARVDTAEDSR